MLWPSHNYSEICIQLSIGLFNAHKPLENIFYLKQNLNQKVLFFRTLFSSLAMLHYLFIIITISHKQTCRIFFGIILWFGLLQEKFLSSSLVFVFLFNWFMGTMSTKIFFAKLIFYNNDQFVLRKSFFISFFLFKLNSIFPIMFRLGSRNKLKQIKIKSKFKSISTNQH